MIHSIHLYVVTPERIADFIRTVCHGAVWLSLIRPTPSGLIAMNLLRSHTLSTGFVTIEYWASEEAYLEAMRSPADRTLVPRIEQLSLSCFDLGAFSIPRGRTKAPARHRRAQRSTRNFSISASKMRASASGEPATRHRTLPQSTWKGLAYSASRRRQQNGCVISCGTATQLLARRHERGGSTGSFSRSDR
jgi:hypothetical protein